MAIQSAIAKHCCGHPHPGGVARSCRRHRLCFRLGARFGFPPSRRHARNPPVAGYSMGYSLPSDVAVRNRTPRVSLCTRKSVARRLRLQERGARFYSPAPGRWISRDPIGEDGGENCYAHTRNQSVNLVDPWGLMAMNWRITSSKTGGFQSEWGGTG
jgi:RHS repeat-associated protein